MSIRWRYNEIAMRSWMLALLSVGLCLAGAAPRQFVGVIHDNRCVGPNCATQCSSTKAPVYTLQSGEDSFVLSDQKTPAEYAGRKVIVTGTVGKNNRLIVTSIAPAR